MVAICHFWYKSTHVKSLESLTQSGQTVWRSEVVKSAPWWYLCHPSLTAVSAVGLSGMGCFQVQRASGCLVLECTPALGPPLHSGGPESLSDTHMYVAGCTSHGSGRGAGSQLRREQRFRSVCQRVMLAHEGAEMTFL